MTGQPRRPNGVLHDVRRERAVREDLDWVIVDPLEEGPGLADRVLEGESVRPEDVLCRPDPKDQVLPGGGRDGNPSAERQQDPRHEESGRSHGRARRGEGGEPAIRPGGRTGSPGAGEIWVSLFSPLTDFDARGGGGHPSLLADA